MATSRTQIALLPLITIALCGDVMTGRGVDQILPHPVDPVLYEPVVRDAREYVHLAEEAWAELAKDKELVLQWDASSCAAAASAAGLATVISMVLHVTGGSMLSCGDWGEQSRCRCCGLPALEPWRWRLPPCSNGEYRDGRTLDRLR